MERKSIAGLCFAIVLGTGGLARAQNLVANGSFEDYTLCPTTLGQVERAVGWTIISGSPDYYNRCNTNDSMDVPLNVVGYQDAFDGDGYVGSATYLEGAPSVRECYQHSLISPLIPGMPVYLSMMVSPGGFGNDPDNNSIRFASSGIGMKFSMQSHTSVGLWSGNVALHLTEVLNDTSSWVQVGGVYIPDSAYTYVAVGCFLPDSLINIEELDVNGQWNAAYSFVDDVCVSFNSIECPLTIGIYQDLSAVWSVAPNPFRNVLRLKLDSHLAHHASLLLTDGTGRLCQSMHIPDGTTEVTWPLIGLADGYYLVQLRNSFGQFRPIRVVHVNL